VWQIASIAVYMLLGANFNFLKLSKDSDIPWAELKNKASKNTY
jgi:hypothetical protein